MDEENNNNEEVVDMSGYDLNGPAEYDHSIKPFVPAENKVKRTCYNKECDWEGMIGENQRMCPACGAEVKGWRSRYSRGPKKGE